MGFENLIVLESSTIRTAIENLERSGQKVIFGVDSSNCVTGLLTDGDIRRGFLNGLNLDNKVLKVLKRDFIFLREGDSPSKVKKLQ